MAYNDLIGKYGWDAVTILYENNESMSRLKEVLDRTAKVSDYHIIIKLRLKYSVLRVYQIIINIHTKVHTEISIVNFAL